MDDDAVYPCLHSTVDVCNAYQQLIMLSALCSLQSAVCNLQLRSVQVTLTHKAQRRRTSTRRDRVTDEEMACYREANHRFGNDILRVARYMSEQAEIGQTTHTKFS